MIGLGVGIDYALFIVTRYRENLHHGHTPEEATSIAIDTAGRAVAFAGVTVVISFLGMLVMGVSLHPGPGRQLGRGRRRHDRRRVAHPAAGPPRLRRRAHRGQPLARRRSPPASLALGLVGAGLKIAPLAGAGVPPRRARRPAPASSLAPAQAGGAAPAAQADPRDLRLPLEPAGSSTARGRPPSAARVVLARAGRPGARPAPRLLRREQLPRGHHHPPGLRPAGRRLRPRLQRPVLPGRPRRRRRRPGRAHGHHRRGGRPIRDVAFVSPAIPNGRRARRPTCWQVTPRHAPQDEATTELVHRLRNEVLVDGEAALGSEIAVTGQVPATVDFSGLPQRPHAVLLRWPCCCVSFLLMMAVFRSVLVPLKAVIMNLLSIGAAYGITVAIVQWALAERHHRPRSRSDRDVRADDVLRHRVRPVDGLRGVPALAG